MFADGKKKTLQAIFQTQAPKPPKFIAIKTILLISNAQVMIELPGIANEYAQYIFVCISIEVIYSHINMFMYKYYAYIFKSMQTLSTKWRE